MTSRALFFLKLLRTHLYTEYFVINKLLVIVLYFVTFHLLKISVSLFPSSAHLNLINGVRVTPKNRNKLVLDVSILTYWPVCD